MFISKGRHVNGIFSTKVICKQRGNNNRSLYLFQPCSTSTELCCKCMRIQEKLGQALGLLLPVKEYCNNLMSSTNKKVTSFNNQLKKMVRTRLPTNYSAPVRSLCDSFPLLQQAYLGRFFMLARHQFAWFGVIVGYIGKT